MPVIKHNPQGLLPASTVVSCQLLDARWKLEIEALAAK